MFNTTIGATSLFFVGNEIRTGVPAELLAALAGARRLVVIDLAPNVVLPALKQIRAALPALELHLCDHHGITGEPRSDRDCEIVAAVEELRALGVKAVITTRKEYASCVGLFQPGEFSNKGDVIVAGQDFDSLLTSLHAAGRTYSGIREDADMLDGPQERRRMEALTPNGQLLVRAMASLPPYNPQRPEEMEEAKASIFCAFADHVGGVSEATGYLEQEAGAFEAAVAEARRILNAATRPEGVDGVLVLDLRGAGQYDRMTLAAPEKQRDLRIVASVLGGGVIAKLHGGVQIRLVAPDGDVRKYLPPESEVARTPEAGVICNVDGMAYVSQSVWDAILTRLRDEKKEGPTA
jgi:hypothetical protein